MGLHELVALAFIGPRHVNQVVRHKDANKLNCHKNNLEYGTYSDNNIDAYQHALSKGDEGYEEQLGGTAKLTCDCIRAIREDVRPHAEIANDFNVSQSNVSMIKSGKRWSNVI